MNDDDYNAPQPPAADPPQAPDPELPARRSLSLLWLVGGIAALVMVIIVILLLINQNGAVKNVALGGSADTQTAEAILAAADAALSSTNTMSYTMAASFSNLPGGGDTPSQLTLSGAIVRPDRYTMSGSGVGDVLVIGPDSWRRALGGDWVKGSSGLGGLIDPNTLADSSKYYTDVQRLSDEGIDGVACYHLKFTVDTARLKSATNGPDLSSASIVADAWIGKQDSLERQLRLLINLPTSGGNISGTVNIKLAGFNQPITIEPPQLFWIFDFRFLIKKILGVYNDGNKV